METKEKTTEKILIPWKCDCSLEDWQERNCDRCAKGFDDQLVMFRCNLQRDIYDAYFKTGWIPAETAKAIGYKKSGYLWDCAKRILKQ